LLVVENHASKLAHRMACALLRPHDELQVSASSCLEQPQQLSN